MNLNELELMPLDDLWQLHMEIDNALAVRLAAEKEVLEARLKQLEATQYAERRVATSERRQYPPVFPKFRNPNDPSETWSGRGKQPRWVAEQLRAGKRMDDFRIEMAAV